ncbi:MAG: ribosome biogenesis GTPase YqeH [Bacilli bacterium]|nr:ribosome biogenesis GTPase YqeH [Bacilli bacterium]
MSILNIVRRCHNCGVILQGDDPHAEGYIDKNVLSNPTARVLFCNKCFEESRYNFMPRTPKVSEDYLSMLEDAEASDALIVYVVDLFSFENSFVPEVTEIIEGLNMLIVANKRDLLPKDYSDDALREYVAHRARNARLKVTHDDVILTSLTSFSDSSKIFDEIESRRKRHDVYVLGAVGAGKTQLIYSLLHSYQNNSSKAITSSNYPGTSLKVMQIPLDTSTYMYETPGIPVDNSIVSKLDMEGARVVMPDEPVKARVHTLDKGDCLLIGGVARIELREGNKQEVKAYFAKGVSLVKIRAGRAEEFMLRKAATGALTPASPFIVSSSDFDAFDLSVEESGPRDIGIAGLGWLKFEGNAQVWRIFTPKNVAIYTTRSKIR